MLGLLMYFWDGVQVIPTSVLELIPNALERHLNVTGCHRGNTLLYKRFLVVKQLLLLNLPPLQNVKVCRLHFQLPILVDLLHL